MCAYRTLCLLSYYDLHQLLSDQAVPHCELTFMNLEFINGFSL